MSRSFLFCLLIGCSGVAGLLLGPPRPGPGVVTVRAQGPSLAPTPRCGCSGVTVKGPDGVTGRGQPMTFTATVTGAAKNISYNWTVSAGGIVSGEGTSSIVVDNIWGTEEVTATVGVGGILSTCECTARATGKTELDRPQQTSVFGSIRGRVVNAKGKPVPGKQVYLLPAQASSTMTDKDGYYKFEDVPAMRDAYRVAVGSGWAFRYVTVEVQGFVENQAPVIKLR